MTLILQIAPPFNAKPRFFSNENSTWVGWLWFGLTLLHVPLADVVGGKFTMQVK